MRLTRGSHTVAALALLIPAVAAGAWTPPANLGTADSTGSNIDVEITTQGHALAAWSERPDSSDGAGRSARFAYRPAGGVFGPTISVDPLSPQGTPGDPLPPGHVSTDSALAQLASDGTARAIWQRSPAQELWTSTSLDGAAYTPPAQIGAGFATYARSAQNVAGDIAIVNHDGGVAYKRAAAPIWSTTSFGGGNVREATASVDPSGRVLIAWIDNQGRVKGRKLDTTTGAFLAPTRLIGSESAIAASQIALTRTGFDVGIEAGTDAAGRGVIVWQRKLAGRVVMRAAFVTATASLRAPGVRSISGPDRRAGQFDAAMAPNGNATIVWRDAGGTTPTTTGALLYARRSPVARNWTAPTRVAPGTNGLAISRPSVAMARNTTYVGWLSPGAAFGDVSMQVARRGNVGPWSRTVLQTGFDDRGIGAVDMSARGFWAIAGWRDTAGGCCTGYRTSLWDPTS